MKCLSVLFENNKGCCGSCEGKPPLGKLANNRTAEGKGRRRPPRPPSNLGLSSLLLNLEILSTSSDETGSSGGHETGLLTAGSVSRDGRGVTDVLLVTTTMGMVDGVHSNTSNSGPCASALCLPSVVGVSGLANGLVGSATAGNEADHGSAGPGDGGTGARGKSDTGLLAIFGVTDDDGRGAGGSCEAASVTSLGLAVGDDGTFGEAVDGQDIADGESSY